jgi:hypothetical protein
MANACFGMASCWLKCLNISLSKTVLPGLGILVRIDHFWFQDDLCYSTLWSVDSWSVPEHQSCFFSSCFLVRFCCWLLCCRCLLYTF